MDFWLEVMNPKRMILCLGPHRTGTSAVTAAIAALGADLGFAAAYANEENRKGFFEHDSLLALNETLLARLGGTWDAPTFQGKSAIAGAGHALDDLRDAAKAWLVKDFAASTVAVLKDPRLCLLLEFWLPVLRDAGFAQIDLVHVLRDPFDAAQSQRTRAGQNPDFYEIGRDLPEGAALWLSHMGQMWDGFAEARHLVLSYDRLVDDPEPSLQRLAAFVNLAPDAARLGDYAHRFLDASLRRSRRAAGQRAIMDLAVPQAARVFDLLMPLCDTAALSPQDIAPVLAIWQDPQTMQALDTVLRPALARLSGGARIARMDRARLLDEKTEQDRAVSALRAELAQMDQARDELIGQLRAQDAESAAQLAVFGREMAILRHELTQVEQARDALIAQLQAQAAENASQGDLFGREMTTLRAELAHQETARDDLIGQRTALEAEISRLRAENSATVQALQARHAQDEAQHMHDRMLLERDLEAAQRDIDRTRADLVALQSSRSWKISAPIRALGAATRQAATGGARAWVRFNHLAKRSYRAVQRRAPWAAEPLRRVLAPMVRAGNRAILHSDYVPVPRLVGDAATGQVAFQFDYQRPRILQDFKPLVTILVPNYNHAPYLRQRLDTIYAQTWTHYEVLLMDDCSTDDSRVILQEYAERYPDRTRLILNEVNSGGPFRQWEKGLREARGEVVWVAESDDWSSDNFLETLVPFFANPAVQLAFAPTTFMNGDGTEQVWSMEDYLNDLGPERWASSFVKTAPQIVRECFAEKNIIPNVSSAIFRRTDRLEAIENDVWRTMRTCGDWVFYLNQIRGGLLAYSPDAHNFYRLHSSNTSVGSYSKDSYYREHEEVAKTVQRHYRVDPAVFRRQRQNLILHWTRNRPGFDQAEFDRCYSLARITAEAARRKPRLLMAGYAFCSGGGETFPINLANVMKTAGYDVTFLDCGQEEEIKGIRDLLAPDIPVVSNFEDLNGILRDFEIEVIHSHHAWVDNTILDILPEDSPVKTVITLHGMYETIADDQLKRILPRLVKRTAQMVYIAEKNIEALVSRGLARAADLARIDNALPKGRGHAVDRAGLGIADDAFVLTLVSRAIPEKGWQEAVDAVTLARAQSGADIHLLLVGGGDEQTRLAETAPPFVHLVGFRNNTRDYFATADMGFLPSRFKGESFPLVIIDCLQAGRPVIASDLGEVRNMLTTKDGVAGLVFALNDWQVPIAPLAGQIADLALNRDRVAAMQALVDAAAQRFDPDLMRGRYDAVYLGVVTPDVTRQAAE